MCLCDFVEIDGWTTTLKLRVVSQQQQLLRNDFESPVPAEAAQALAAKASAHLADAAVLIVADYDKGAARDSAALIQAANATGTASVVDPKFKPFASYAGASLLKPNRQEFTAAAGQFGDVDALADSARALCRAHGFDAMVVTVGADGMTVVEGPAPPTICPPARWRCTTSLAPATLPPPSSAWPWGLACRCWIAPAWPTSPPHWPWRNPGPLP